MKKLRFVTIGCLVAVTVMTVWAFKVRYKPHEHPTKAQGIYQYKGANGWTLEEDFIVTLPGKKPFRAGTTVEYFHSDGRRRSIQNTIKSDGTLTCESITTYTPDLGIIGEKPSFQKRYFLDRYSGHELGRVDIDQKRQDPSYVRDEVVLGYLCVVLRITNPQGEVTEDYDAVELGGYPIRQVFIKKDSTQVFQATSIKLGNPPEEALIGHDDWPVSFEAYEKKIATTEAQAKVDSRFEHRLTMMREVLESAKQRFSKR